MRTHTLILLGLLLAGCSSGGFVPPSSAPSRFTGEALPPSPRDGGEQLLDLAPRADLQGALPDLRCSPADMASAPDLAAPPPDMAHAPDLAAQPDLATVPADMAGCVVKLGPPVALPVRLSGEAVSWPLGDVPNPAGGVDVVLQFTRTDLGLTLFTVKLADPSCAGCPAWGYLGAAPGTTLRYAFHSTAGWAHAVLSVDVPLGAVVEIQKVELTAPCR